MSYIQRHIQAVHEGVPRHVLGAAVPVGVADIRQRDRELLSATGEVLRAFSPLQEKLDHK